MGDDRLAHEIAGSVDAPIELLPALSELFAGIASLGSSPGPVIRMLRGAGLRREHRVLDLACGKGALAIQLAARVGCSVLAVDACPAFLESAAAYAVRRGAADRVRWLHADVRRAPRQVLRGGSRRGFDAALMLGLFPLAEAAQLLRRLTRPGGIYVIDDCVLDHRRGRPPRELAATPTPAECDALIELLGDRVEAIDLPSPSRTYRMNERLYVRLARNAEAVRRDHPRLRAALREFLRRQRAANEILCGPVRPCVWLIRRL
ncbi:Geranyl diphosphate 2-C-methyltransferase [Phycisphaerae bacterium RAS1]|nr:Geranyl diphosphate 2-C-methyltransferase [Phycisphaerae bacterium RAS1]